ncbi:hypothetical protein BJ508DRAFT_172535 [Ascobolus immersus RN42]|uniref:Uncharacterized protein n=1 Tax=Ascobolus immersus RN42 TaxID=1160509 RepID=A0A3N4HVZ8_ASCIM|nr:hypothetical protein BJ508DRAFT_172535 [Ascobolus immersus RN42]
MAKQRPDDIEKQESNLIGNQEGAVEVDAARSTSDTVGLVTANLEDLVDRRNELIRLQQRIAELFQHMFQRADEFDFGRLVWRDILEEGITPEFFDIDYGRWVQLRGQFGPKLFDTKDKKPAIRWIHLKSENPTETAKRLFRLSDTYERPVARRYISKVFRKLFGLENSHYMSDTEEIYLFANLRTNVAPILDLQTTSSEMESGAWDLTVWHHDGKERTLPCSAKAFCMPMAFPLSEQAFTGRVQTQSQGIDSDLGKPTTVHPQLVAFTSESSAYFTQTWKLAAEPEYQRIVSC